MTQDPYLSIVIPVYNEVESLVPLHREIDAALASLGQAIEILWVDDGSTDGSAGRLLEIAAKDDRVRVLHLDGRYGQSAALDAGFRAARGELTATLDADLQNDPADLPALLAHLDGADVVCGVRSQRQDTRSRRWAARAANAFRNAVTREQVTDVGCSLRVMRSALLKEVKLFRGMHRFLPTLLALEGARVVEIPVSHRSRRFGRSKYGILERLSVGLRDVFAVRWMKSRNLCYRVSEPGIERGSAAHPQPPAGRSAR
jgi:glycosyltransferase involved in cell wall biosynthesis